MDKTRMAGLIDGLEQDRQARNVLLLHYKQSFSSESISTILDLSVGAVAVRSAKNYGNKNFAVIVFLCNIVPKLKKHKIEHKGNYK